MIGPGRRAALTRVAGLSAVLLGTLIVPLDSSVNVDFPFITRHFGLPIPLIQWLVISYTLTSASLMLACGRAADLLGHRRVFLLGCAASTAAFVLCALAPGYGWLLGFRVLQGIGAGLVLSTGPALVTSLYPEAKRPRALALYTAGFAIGGALGASLAGLLITRFGWSVVFWFRAPAAALAFGLGFFLERARRAQAERFDLTGALLLVGTIIALLLMLNRLRSVALAAALAAVSTVGAWCFIRQERQVRHPIIDLALFRDRGFAAANLGNLLVNLAGFAVPLLVPFQLARLPGISIALVGMLLALSSVGMMLGAPLAGRLLAVVPARWLLPAGAVVVAVGLAGIGGLAELPVGLAAAMLLQGVGQGVFQVAYFDLITATMPLHSRGVAGSLGMLTRTMGVVSGASLLMLGFQAIGAGAATDVAFADGFRGVMHGAAALAAAVALGLALRGRVGSSARCK